MNSDVTHDFESLEPPLDAAVRAALAEPLPHDAVERVKARAKQLANIPTASRPRIDFVDASGRKVWRGVRWGLIAAAALLVMATGITLLLDRSAGHAFAQVFEKAKSAGSVQVTTILRLGNGPEQSSRMFFKGNRQRFEEFNGALIVVADLNQKRSLVLNTEQKLAQLTEIEAEDVRYLRNPIEALRSKLGDAQSIGEENLNGRRTKLFRLLPLKSTVDAKGETLVWVDVESDLPTKIVISDPDPKHKTEIRYEEFVWNQPLDDKLFSLDLPADFQSGIVISKPAPRLAELSPATATSLDAPNVGVDGILSRDRVPARIVWDPQGKSLTALMRDPESTPTNARRHELRQWDVTTGKLRYSELVDFSAELAGTADGKFLATVSGLEIRLRDSASGKIIRTWETDKHVKPMAFSPDGKILATGIAEWGGQGRKESGGIQFWDVERGGLVRIISEDQVTRFVRFSIDGRYLATSSGYKGLSLWETSTGKFIRIFPGWLADFSPDGETIASVSSPYGTLAKVDVYRLSDGSRVKSLTAEKATETSWLLQVAFSPDGRLLAAADWNGTVTVWNVATGERQHAFTDDAGIHTAEFSPDGATLATGSESRMLRLRKLPAESKQPEKGNK